VLTETLDHTVGTRDGVVGKSKDTHEERIGSQRQPIVERVVSSLGLRKVKLRFRFGGVDEIDELNTILHEEDRNVVSDDIPVSLLSVELDSKSSNFTSGFGSTVRSENCRESSEDGSLDANFRENFGASNILKRSV